MTLPKYKEKLLIDEFKLHVTMAKPNYACWAGASHYGATDAVSTRSFTREAFLKEKAIPDWSNLRFNTVYSEEQRQG